MAHQHILATPPSEDAILDSLLEHIRSWNARQPQYIGYGDCNLEAEMPLLLNPREAPFACREPPAVFEAINAQFSAQVHAIFGALRRLEELAETEPDLIRQTDGLQPEIQVGHQSFDIYPKCPHRAYHTSRLTVLDPDRLPLLHRVTKLGVRRGWLQCDGPERGSPHMRPASLRMPLELATRLPNLRELDFPWLWERLPIAFSSQALRRFARVWEGPWRDSRIEFARGPHIYGNNTEQKSQMPDLVGTSSFSSSSEFGGKDPVSLGLRHLGRRLEELDARALITPDLFASDRDDDDDGATDHNLPSWPNMRHLKVEFHPCAPDGRWYFSGPRGEDPHADGGFAITREAHYPPIDDLDEDEYDEELHTLWHDEQEEHDDSECEERIWDCRRPDLFRTRPIAERIEPLLLAFASSIRRESMPLLEDAELFSWLAWQPSVERARVYEGSEGAPFLLPDEDDHLWAVAEGWRPGQEVMRAFEDLVGGDDESVEWKGFEFVNQRSMDDAFF
ncbi:hypothetical protein PG988_004483 [Apiospora saccharicola]